jgi:hypothetical protein
MDNPRLVCRPTCVAPDRAYALMVEQGCACNDLTQRRFYARPSAAGELFVNQDISNIYKAWEMPEKL